MRSKTNSKQASSAGTKRLHKEATAESAQSKQKQPKKRAKKTRDETVNYDHVDVDLSGSEENDPEPVQRGENEFFETPSRAEYMRGYRAREGYKRSKTYLHKLQKQSEVDNAKSNAKRSALVKNTKQIQDENGHLKILNSEMRDEVCKLKKSVKTQEAENAELKSLLPKTKLKPSDLKQMKNLLNTLFEHAKVFGKFAYEKNRHPKCSLKEFWEKADPSGKEKCLNEVELRIVNWQRQVPGFTAQVKRFNWSCTTTTARLASLENELATDSKNFHDLIRVWSYDSDILNWLLC